MSKYKVITSTEYKKQLLDNRINLSLSIEDREHAVVDLYLKENKIKTELFIHYGDDFWKDVFKKDKELQNLKADLKQVLANIKEYNRRLV